MQLEHARKNLGSLESEYDKAHEERLAATKNVWHLDKALSRAVMTLSLDTLVLTENNRKDSRFLRLFPEAPGKNTTPVAGAQKMDYVRSIIETLSLNKDLAPLGRHLETVGDALKALEEAISRRKELEIPEKRARTKRDEAKMKAIKIYNMMYARLQILFDDDTATVNSFFADLRR
jgi:hypothetical protein